MFYATLGVFGWAALGGGIRALTMPARAPLQLDEAPERFVSILMPAPQLEVEPAPSPRAREEREEAVEDLHGACMCIHFPKTGRSSHGVMVADLFAEGGERVGSLEEALASIEEPDGECEPEGPPGECEEEPLITDRSPIRTERARGSVTIGAPSLDLTGGEPKDVTRTMRKYSGQVKYCYEQQLKKDASLEGTLWLSWTVRRGRATGVVLDSNTTGSEALGRCVVGKVRTWRYPDEVDGTVSVSLVLEPEGPTR